MQVRGAIGPSTILSTWLTVIVAGSGDQEIAPCPAAAAIDQAVRLQLQQNLFEEFSGNRSLRGDLVRLERARSRALREGRAP